MPIASKRRLIVPVDSSAAKMPLPGATIAFATLFNSTRFMAFLRLASLERVSLRLKSPHPQNLDARQRLAFHPFQERAAGRRHIAEALCGAGRIEGRHRVTAA